MKKNEISKLTDTAKDFFHLLAEFAKVNNVSSKIAVVMVDDELQELHSDTCSIFQLISINFYLTLMKTVRS